MCFVSEYGIFAHAYFWCRSSRFVHQPLVVRKYLANRQMQAKLQRHQNGELGRRQLLAIEPENALGFLDQTLQRLALDVVQLGAEQQTSAGAQFAILLAYEIGQNQLLEVDVRLRHGQQIDATVHFVDVTHFALDAAQLAQRQLNVREFLAELVVELLFQIGRLHVVDDGRYVRRKREECAMFAGNQFGVVEQIGAVLVLCGVNGGEEDDSNG